MRAALLFVLVSLLLGGAFREWRRGHETRFQELVASLEAEDVAESGLAGPGPGPDEANGGSRAGGRALPAEPGRGKSGRVAEAAAPRPGSLDPERATAAEWERLPGIGPALARRIVEDRASRGPFGGPEGLLRVPGIGPRILGRIRPYLARPASDALDSMQAN